MALVNKKVTPEELAARLVSSRKIMNKVDTGDYQKGNIDENLLTDGSNGFLPENQSTSVPTHRKSLGLPVGVPSVEKIRGSNLPDNIKKAMIETPIEQITLNDSLDMDFVNRAKKLMEQDGAIPVKKGQQPRGLMQIKEEIDSSVPSNLEIIIENIIRKVLDEKLTQILNAQAGTTINENLAIKVGDSIFTGKITKVKNTK